MKHRRTATMLLLLALSSVLVLGGCGTDAAKEKGSETTQTGEIDPALAPKDDATTGEEANDPVTSMQTENALAQTVEQQNGKAIVNNAESMLVVVNKERSLPDGYEPPDLVEPNVKFSFSEEHEKRHMRKEAAEALEKLFANAEENNIELNAVSGYRSYKRQQSLYNYYVDTQGEEYASRVSAVPGTSEHQTGLAIDVSSPSVGNVLEEVFGGSVEGKWLAEHAHEFGFIIRYPQDGEAITGYLYEPWHIRYVGVEAATAIYNQKTTLEQFLQE
ncbi:M15 family metallopeptidase [Paenibacillus sp. 1001270B_150601_E10]|uniref:M15 family metallopeptidase n=1 Tax=Paenibacillus sp. 1001270B_150601_E10 TaxID=2787079 RepID=UPI001E5E7D57|nr:M15 family metallopeptidase [Paenibacillus sp. 1001270B_150601_E10]